MVRRSLALALFACFATLAFAQGYETQLISHTTVDMTVGDLDSDGDIDIISGGIRNLVWNENQGDGTFVSRTLSLDAQEVQTVIMIDLDTDGHQDLVVADMAVNRILYYRNNGDNTFDRYFLYSNSGGTSGIAIADLDGDGDLDIAGTAFTQNKVYWLRNEGGFQFTSVNIVTGLTGVSHVVAHDYDNDGDTDLAVTVQTAGATRLLRNNGTGTFTNELLATMATPRSIVNGDVDQDGDMDILYSGGGGTGWFENTGVSFTQRSVTTYTGGRGVNIGDLNGDGYNDLITCDYEEDDLVWRGYSATGQFMTPGGILDTDFDYVSMAFAADLDGDGDLDIAAGSSFDLRAYINNGAGTFTKRFLNRYLGDARGIDRGDFDNDGDMDLMAVGGLYLTWHENDGNGAFTARIAREPSNGRIQLSGGITLRAADMDGDGDDDAVFCERSGNQVSWLENLGTGFFTKRTAFALSNAYSCDPLDFDDDGDMDVVATSLNGGDVYWYENNGSEVFTQHAVNTSYPTPYEARAHDFDNDGDMDVVVACYSSLQLQGKVVLNVNQGDGTFDDYEIDSNAPNVTSVYWTDLDSDGDKDIVYTTADNNCINWLEYTNGWFTEHILATGVAFATYVVADDLDGDGDVDMAATALSDRTTDWYENDGNQVFTRHELARNVVNPQFINVGDIDADGTPEIFATCVETDAVHLYRRTGITVNPVVGPPPTACHDLFISEMVHMPGDQALALEIYNPRSVPVDLTGYALRFYPNGEFSYDASMLTGTIPAGGTHVVVAPNYTTNINTYADQITNLWFDGSDAIALVHNGTPIDIIGKVGEYFEDGDYWFNNGVGTFYTVLVRKPTVDRGDVDGTDAFLPDVQWIAYNVMDYSHLGSHTGPCSTVCTPSVSISTTASGLCAGEQVTVNATAAAQGTTTYQWWLNGTAVGSNSASYITPPLTANSIVQCVVTSNAACAPAVGVGSNVLVLPITDVPAPVASINGSIVSASPVAGATYQWYRNGSPLAGATGQTHTATQAGNYTVVATVDGCSSAPSNVVVYDLSTGIGNPGDASIVFAPNPVHDLLHVRTAEAISAIDVRDALGAVVVRTRTAPVDLSTVAPGVYHVTVRTTEGVHTQRVLVQ